jgi:hypothetical protein
MPVMAMLLSSLAYLSDGQSAPVSRSPTPRGANLQCIQFQSDKLPEGKPFRVPIMRGLELRMDVNAPTRVGPKEQPDTDYLWIVSPPLQYAPQLYLGPSYDIPAERIRVGKWEPLFFVLNQADYDTVYRAVYERGLSGTDYFRLREQLPLGRVTITVTEYSWAWASFNGEACAPK